jgi:predicted transcriptional regulator
MNLKPSNGSPKRRYAAPRVPVTIRLPEEVIERINHLLDGRDIPLSRNNWFLEAAIEKLRRSDAEGSHGQE